jgi:hypothetical protein
VSIIQGPVSVAPCQTLISRFATFSIAVRCPGPHGVHRESLGGAPRPSAILRSAGQRLTTHHHSPQCWAKAHHPSPFSAVLGKGSPPITILRSAGQRLTTHHHSPQCWAKAHHPSPCCGATLRGDGHDTGTSPHREKGGIPAPSSSLRAPLAAASWSL